MASLSLSSGVVTRPFSPSFDHHHLQHHQLQSRHCRLRKVLVPGSYNNLFHSIADEFYPLLKLKMAIRQTQKQIPQHPPHWTFCYTILPKVSQSFSLLIQQLHPDYRHVVIIMYLVLRTLDTVEDDTSIPTDIKVTILKAFHRDIYDTTWHFPCGTRQHDKVLVNEFHHVSNAFLELDKDCQEIIEAGIKRVGTSMAKFICKEVETVDDYDEYCHSISGLIGLYLVKLFHASGSEDLPPDSLALSMGLFNQKAHFIKDFLDDINEIPKPRIFWPREIWSKYAIKLEDLTDEENSDKAVQCLNEMVTDSLRHVEDCLTFFSTLKQHSLFRFCAIPQIIAMGNLALYYDNIQLFRHAVEMRHGVAAKIFDRTKTVEDVYGAFFDYSSMMKSKVNKNDPNATLTLSRLDAIQKACTDSGLLKNKRKLYIV